MILLETGESLGNLIQRTNLIQRQTHNAALFRQSLKNGLTNPPDSVGNKLEASGLVKFSRSFNKTEIALVYEIGQTESLILILFCD